MKVLNVNLRENFNAPLIGNEGAKKKNKMLDVETVQASLGTFFKYLGAAATYNYLATKPIEKAVMEGYDFCPALPESVYNYSSALCSFVLNFHSSSIQDNASIITPIVEEMVFRVGLQEILLKRLPKALLHRVGYDKLADLVDSKPAKIARVVCSAAAFSLIHAMPPSMSSQNCSAVKLTHTFLGGLGLGAIQEVTGNPLYAMAFHAGNNIQTGVLLKAFNAHVQCPTAPFYPPQKTK